MIDQFVAADARKFAKPGKDNEKVSEDSKPLLGGTKTKSDSNDDFDNLEKIGKDYDQQLNDQLPQNGKSGGN